MKTIKIVLIALLSVIVGFVCIGILNSEQEFENQVIVNRPVADCFAVFNNEANMGKWMDNFEQIEKISGNPNEVGSKYKLVFVDGAEEMALFETLTAFKENELFSFDYDNDLITGHVDVHFVAAGSATKIIARSRYSANGFFMQCLFPFFQGTMQQQSQKNYDQLRELIEGS